MNNQTEQIYKGFNRQLQIELAEKYPDLRPILAEIVSAESKQSGWLADWGSGSKPRDAALDDMRDLIDSSLSISQVVEFYGYKLDRLGRCPCMFHHGKNRNFSVYDGKKYKCFVCGAQGDVFSFVMELFGVGFSEAIKKLCSDFGLGPVVPSSANITRRRRTDQDRADHAEFRMNYLNMADLFRFLYSSIRKYRPTDEDSDTWHPLYVYSVHRIGRVRAWLDEHANTYANITAWREARPDDDRGIN